VKRLILLMAGATVLCAQNPVQRELSCVSAAGVDAYTCNLPVAPANYAAIQGKVVSIYADVANTGQAFVNLNSLGNVPLKKIAGGLADLADNDVRVGWFMAIYNGSAFQLVSQLGNSATGTGSTAFGDLTSGTNTAASMVLGSGASLATTGTGTITANKLNGASLGTTAATISVPNAGTTGTTAKKLAKLTGAPSTAVIAGTGDTSGIIGIVVSGAGTTGSAEVARMGQALCTFDGPTTAGNYVQNSPTVAGACHDAGSSYPTSGQVIGFVTQTVASGDANVLIRPDIQAAGTTSGGGCVSLGATGDVIMPGFAFTLNAYPQGNIPHQAVVNGGGANTTVLTHRFIPCAWTPNKISFNLATIGGVGCKAMVGIYNNARTQLLVSTGLITDSTTLSCMGQTGLRTFTASTNPAATGMGVQYPAGWYWFAATSNEATMKIESANLNTNEAPILNGIATQHGSVPNSGGCGTVNGELKADMSGCSMTAANLSPHWILLGY
jgi:hypothetical protein